MVKTKTLKNHIKKKNKTNKTNKSRKKRWTKIKNKNKLVKTFGNDIKSIKYKYKNKWFIKHLSSDTENIKYINNKFSNKLIEQLDTFQFKKILLFSQFFNQQSCQTFCASAAIVILLNIINRNGKLVLKFPYLMENKFLPYPIITQRSLYNIISQTEAIGTYKGLTLSDVKNIFDILHISSKVIYPPDRFNNNFIETIFKHINKKNTYALLNYGCAWKKKINSNDNISCKKGRQEAFEFVENRDAIFWKKNQFPYRLKPRGGHFVPIATAVKYKNQYWFLIIEVANFKYNWFWINEKGLYDTMSTIDNSTHKTRGLIIIQDN